MNWLSVLSLVSTILVLFLLSVSQAQQKSLRDIEDYEEWKKEILRRDEEERQAAIERRRKAIERIKPIMVEIPTEIAKTKVLVRRHIDDFGMNVEQVIESLYLNSALDKDKLCSWESRLFSPDNEYNLVCQYKSKIRMTFKTSKDKSVAMLSFHDLDRNRPLPVEYMARLLF